MKLHAAAAVWLLAAASFGAVASQDAGLEAGRQLFTGGTTPACAVCHTLRDAGASGEIGPVLDELQPDEARVANAVRTGLGVMPAFREQLSDQQIATLARYVAQASRLKR